MHKWITKLIENVLSVYYGIRMKFSSNSVSQIVHMQVYEDICVTIIHDNDRVNYSQWLEKNTDIPQICVGRATSTFADDHTDYISKLSPPQVSPMPMSNYNEKPYYYIHVNTAFLESLTEEQRLAMIEHELAHIRHGDVDAITGDDVVDVTKELAADYTATMRGHGVHLSLALKIINSRIPDVSWRRRAKQIAEFRIHCIDKYAIPALHIQDNYKKDLDLFTELLGDVIEDFTM